MRNPLGTGGFVLIAMLAAAFVAEAHACFACSGNGGDFTAMGLIAWQMDALHASVAQSMAEAQAGLARGEISGALIGLIGLGFLYGGVHALGPGHGKLALGAHAAASGEGWRAYALASLAASGGHVFSAVLTAGAILLVFQGAIADADTLRRILTAVAGVGLAVVGSLLLFAGHSPHFGGHDHSHHAEEHDASKPRNAVPSRSLLAVAFASALVPCSSSLVVLLYGAAHGAIALALAVTAFIALGQASVQTGAAFAGLTLRRAFALSFGGTALRVLAGAAGAAILIVGIAALHSALS